MQQGSMQAQGEASELALEKQLKTNFPFDQVVEIKGRFGADCVLNVKSPLGRQVGCIVFECKNTKHFSEFWIKKLQMTWASMGAQVAVLVTTKMPTDNDKAHLRDGIWVCGFSRVYIDYKSAQAGIIDISRVIAAEGARDAKADVMYDFLTSVDFARNIEQMVSPIFRMKEQLEKEKSAFSKIWKERQSLIEASIGGAESPYMKIQGIVKRPAGR